MSLHCLWQSCLLQNSTGIPAPFETFLWLALRRGPIFGAVGLHAFCLPSLRTLHVYIYIYTVYMFIYCCYLFVILLAFLILGVNGLDDGKIYRKALYLMIKTMVSCKFSLKPIH